MREEHYEVIDNEGSYNLEKEYDIIYLYDQNGQPYGMQVKPYDISSEWDPTPINTDTKVYYFEKNLQGDIVSVINEAGYKVVGYTY